MSCTLSEMDERGLNTGLSSRFLFLVRGPIVDSERDRGRRDMVGVASSTTLFLRGGIRRETLPSTACTRLKSESSGTIDELLMTPLSPSPLRAPSSMSYFAFPCFLWPFGLAMTSRIRSAFKFFDLAFFLAGGSDELGATDGVETF